MKHVHLLGLLFLGGCSAVVNDLNGIPGNPEGCLAQPELQAATRPLTLRFRDMQPHGSQKTVVSVARTNAPLGLQARVILMPTGAAALGPRRLELDPAGRDPEDGLRCRLATAAPLDFDLAIPSMIPPDAAGNGGPFEIQFWSDLNRTGGTVEPFPADHSWIARVCDDGTATFRHNTGFESLTDVQPAGGPLTLLYRPDMLNPALDSVRAALVRAGTLPFVLTVMRQELMVGYLRTELECVTGDDGGFALTIPGVVDGGAFHSIQFYLDTQRNGQYDEACDISCADTLESRAGETATDPQFILYEPFAGPGAGLYDAPGPTPPRRPQTGGIAAGGINCIVPPNWDGPQCAVGGAP